MAGMSTCRSIRRIGRGRAAGADAIFGQYLENNFIGWERSGGLDVYLPTPGGVPPSPQPLTHPAKDPGPLRAPGSSFLSLGGERCGKIASSLELLLGSVVASLAFPE
jgi:hypothetical protein